MTSAKIRVRRRYWREPRGLAILLACLALILWRFATPSDRQLAPENLVEGVHEVHRVVDGDTLLLESGARVRLQGIDTPETVREDWPVEPWGPEASAFTKGFVVDANRQVRLTFSLERKDRHDRFLAFVWNGDVMLNEELVRAGLAHARMDYRYSAPMKRRLAAAEKEARAAERGIWSSEKKDATIPGGQSVESTNRSR
jgi:micrococcal nuclease